MTPRPPLREPAPLDTVLAAEASLPPGLADVIGAIAATAVSIARLVRRARLEDVVGAAGATNVQGEAQQKLDVLANRLLADALARCPAVAAIASEEEDEALRLPGPRPQARFGVLFDPLDGSSNIDVAVGIGTIFGVVACDPADPLGTIAQPGRRQLAAGYVLYGSQVALVLTTGAGVDFYVLDPDSEKFLCVERGLVMPAEKKLYSVNEANADSFPDGYRRYLAFAHGAGYSARYIGSMVADVHRTLLKGGVFLYPPTRKDPRGKLRLLYEASPMSLLVERAGGRATTGEKPILDVEPTAVHQRVPVILGSAAEVERVVGHLEKAPLHSEAPRP